MTRHNRRDTTDILDGLPVGAEKLSYSNLKRLAVTAQAIRDQLGELFTDEAFGAAFAVRGKPGWSPGVQCLQVHDDAFIVCRARKTLPCHRNHSTARGRRGPR